MTYVVRHDPALRGAFPSLAVGFVVIEGVDQLDPHALDVSGHLGTAKQRLTEASEGAFPEIRAWRSAFSSMNLKPTQYRCASESLLRRLRTHGELPKLHPLVDYGNALSAAFAIPLAMFDLGYVSLPLLVTYAAGDERYVTFSGEEERPESGEVVFRDADGWAHSRRWTHRQSGRSAVGPSTRRALAVAEGLHDNANNDVTKMIRILASAVARAGGSVDLDDTIQSQI